jgi:DnaJ-class molecular chaperone
VDDVCGGVVMTQNNTFPTSKGDLKDVQRRTDRSTEKDYSHWLRVCPNCGANNPKYMESCTECDVVFESGNDTDVMVQCPTCDGNGTIFLEYLEEFDNEAGDQEERWLPCGDCDGIGKLPKSLIANLPSSRHPGRLQRILLELYEEFIGFIAPR